MTNDLQWVMAGLDRIEGMVLDSSGIISGTSPTRPTAITGSNGFRILGAKEGAATVPAPDVVPITGDDAYIAGFVFASAAARQFALTCAVQDLNVNQYMGNGNAYAIGNSEIGFLDVRPFAPVNVALLFNSQMKSQTPGNVGQGIWGGVIVPRAQGIPLGRETFAERAAGIMRYQFVFSMADQFPWGETFNSNVHGKDQASMMPWSSNNRKGWFAFTGDGNSKTFGPFKDTPFSTAVADNPVWVSGNRLYSGYTIDATLKTITFTNAPASSAPGALYYDHI